MLLAARVRLALAVGVVYAVTELQFRMNEGIASVRISILVATLCFVTAMFAGRQIGRLFVAATVDLLRGL